MHPIAHIVCRDAQVIVATAPMAWGMTAAAQLVVVMGTQARPRLRTRLAATGARYRIQAVLIRFESCRV